MQGRKIVPTGDGSVGRVELWIGPICPWCRIGVTQLERAGIATGVALDIRLRGFRLHPVWPAEGMAWADFQAHRALPDAVFDRVAAVGARHGLAFDFGRIARVPDTTPLHRILTAAEALGRARTVLSALVDSYFLRAENLADRATIRAAAGRAGMDCNAVRAALTDPATKQRLCADEAEARHLGIGGVPFARIGGQLMPGAQREAAYAEALRRTLPSARLVPTGA